MIIFDHFDHLINFQHQFAERERPARTEANKLALYDRTVVDCQMEARQKRTSTRQFAAELGVSQSSVVRMTQDLNLKSIKIHQVDTKVFYLNLHNIQGYALFHRSILTTH